MKKDRTDKNALAQTLVLQCGVRPYLSGCTYLAEAIELYSGEEQTPMSVYRSIAERHSVKPKTVMRNIAYAISKCGDMHNKLSDMMGIKIHPDEIHNGLVIAYLAFKLKTTVA